MCLRGRGFPDVHQSLVAEYENFFSHSLSIATACAVTEIDFTSSASVLPVVDEILSIKCETVTTVSLLLAKSYDMLLKEDNKEFLHESSARNSLTSKTSSCW